MKSFSFKSLFLKKFFLKPLLTACAASTLFVSTLSQANPIVDVLVLYIDAAEQTSAGRDMDARIASYIEYSNQSLANSNVPMRLRLVGAEKINVNYTYVTSNNLAALRTNSQVAQLRQRYGADLVTLLNLRQAMYGGYVCGVGYVPPGNPNTGQLYSNASSAAFSLVGVDCGLSTFIHELGHNMSLGHSYIQESNGGVWPWARGHGVQGLFSTIMAYPQSYGTYNQLPRFSNPDQRECSGQPCGVPYTQTQGADAARNLIALDEQIAAFMPTVVDVEEPEPEPELPLCNKTPQPNNLINNGEFNSLDGWSSLFGASQLNQNSIRTNCVDNILAVTNRSQTYGDAYQSLDGRVVINRDYALSAKFSIAGSSRDTVSLALRITEGQAVRYQYLENVSVTPNEFTVYRHNFRLDASSNPSSVGLLIYGPQPGVSILADEVTLVDVTTTNPGPDPEPENPVVLDERFEQQATGWSSYSGGTLAFSSYVASEGTYSLRSHSRTSNNSGPMREVTGLFDAEQTYNITTQVYVRDFFSSSSNVIMRIYYVDDRGGNWLDVASSATATNRWLQLSGSFVVNPVGSITQMRLVVSGPRSRADIYLDELTATRQ